MRGVSFVGLRFGYVVPQHRDASCPRDPHCVRLKLTVACEIPASGDLKIEKCEDPKSRAVLCPKPEPSRIQVHGSLENTNDYSLYLWVR
jgi:hypothetical protein